MVAFDGGQFVDDCITALREADAVAALREVVEGAVSSPDALAMRFAVPLEPDDDGVLHRSPELLITSAVFPKGFTTGIHDHTVAAVIGVWSGVEDNLLYERSEHGIVATKPKRIERGQVLVLGPDAIHDVHVPTHTWSGALHVYLGDIFVAARSEWTDPTGAPSPFDGENMERRWAEAARRTGLLQP